MVTWNLQNFSLINVPLCCRNGIRYFKQYLYVVNIEVTKMIFGKFCKRWPGHVHVKIVSRAISVLRVKRVPPIQFTMGVRVKQFSNSFIVLKENHIKRRIVAKRFSVNHCTMENVGHTLLATLFPHSLDITLLPSFNVKRTWPSTKVTKMHKNVPLRPL